jgi:5,6-dimethylbenzimidazole synthase
MKQRSVQITSAEREGLYKTIYNRRDTRSEFLPDPVSDQLLQRILNAAHHAPSVGFMQPWDFIIVRDGDTRQRIKDAFETANRAATEMFDETQREQYRSFKLEGIMEAPLGITITCDRNRTGKTVIGRTANKEMDLYSSVCAVQNLWLAARAENLGVGWVSIMHHKALKEILGIPKTVVPIAYLCIGHVSHFHEKPELEKAGWLARMPLEELIHHDSW